MSVYFCLYNFLYFSGVVPNDFLKLFYHIKENQTIYNAYFKLGASFTEKEVHYDYTLAEKYFDNKKVAWFFKAAGCISVDRTICIWDEVEDSSLKLIKTAGTRIGEGSQLIMMGDLVQAENKYKAPSYFLILSYCG